MTEKRTEPQGSRTLEKETGAGRILDLTPWVQCQYCQGNLTGDCYALPEAGKICPGMTGTN
jgi:hypothetical protein